MTEKRILAADRVRRLPREGWSWVDRRFLREYASRLSGDALLLYFFLAAVSDKHGLSFYSDSAIALRLRMTEPMVAAGRDELIQWDLVAYQAPLSQVLSLPPVARGGNGRLSSLGEVLRRLGESS
ncbi:MAG: hypothetical protein KDB14_27025 [Planctomycetales bacterium]|nr:hypothetical protein [Planctomycetales bacterium]